MKKILALALALCMIFALCACGKQEAPAPAAAPAAETTAETETEAPAAVETTFGIEPMSEPVTLGLGYFSGAMHATPFYVMEQKGWLDELGISFDYLSFTSGPVMMEASNEWDICSTGAPGAIAGLLGYDIKTIGFCDEEASINMYVRPDSPIAKSGQGNIEGYPKMYGTVDDWKGITVLLPVGTTAHQSLVTVLEQIGLTADDVTMQNMDVMTAITAFKAGEGDMMCVWTSTSIEAEGLGYVRAASSSVEENHVIIPTTVDATDAALADPVKREAIEKVWELYYRALEWEKDNLEEAATLYEETCSIEGVSGQGDYDLCLTSLKDWFFPFTLDESIKMMTTDGDDALAGKIGNGYIELFNTFDFFMGQEKYTTEQRQFIIDEGKVDSSVAEAVAASIAAR